MRPQSGIAFQTRQFSRAAREGGVEKSDLFIQWKMMQDIDRNLAEVATHAAAAAGLDLETVREVLLANMLAEHALPIDFRSKPPPERKAMRARVLAE